MLALLALWSHLLAALLYGVLAIAQLRHWNGDPLNRPLISAFAVMSVWSIFAGLLDGLAPLTQLGESARNLAFLAFLYGMLDGAGATRHRAVRPVYGAVAAVIGLQVVIGGVIGQYRSYPVLFEALSSTSQILGLTIAAGALVLVHNLYGQATPASRGPLRFPMLALAAMWGFDLHLYTVSYFSYGDTPGLVALRGVVLTAIVPLFALGIRGSPSWKLQISRAATFQSLSLFFILAYLLAMMSASRATELTGSDWGLFVSLGLIALATGTAMVMLVSRRARAALRVLVAKHLFEHRYDYRAEWLRFTDTVGKSASEAAALEERVVKALADIGGAPGGLLLLVDGPDRMRLAARRNSALLVPASGDCAAGFARFLVERAFVVDFGALEHGTIVRGSSTIPVPAWLAAIDGAWAAIPLIHAGELVGMVVLERPPLRRALDWEDFDLFRAAGIQAASYIAEARTQQALADARRFDEFNRRFAFILHDIKNLVSQLSLVSRNAERHADNPEFRADMVATLECCVKKLTDLLSRLSPCATRECEPVRPCPIEPIVDSLLRGRSRGHPVRAEILPGLAASIDPAGLEQALGHLVQNAVEASPAGVPITLRGFESGGEAVIEVSDSGEGMTEDFVRNGLFQPFASTKPGGFGLGAYEARSLITAMGGRLEVDSAPGKGTRFTLILPAASAASLGLIAERKRA